MDQGEPPGPTLRQLSLAAEFLRRLSRGDRTLLAAAKAMGLSTKGLHKQLQTVQERLGVRLYDDLHGGKGIRATEAGLALLPRLDEIERLVAELSDSDEPTKPLVRMTCYAGHVHRLWRRIAELPRHELVVELRVLEDLRMQGADGIREELLNGRADVVVGPSEASWPSSIERSADPLYSWTLIAVPPQGMALPTEGTPKAISGLPLLVSPRGHQSRQLLDRAASAQRVPLDIAVESSSSTARWYLRRAGLGVVVAPDDALYLLRRADRRCILLDPSSGVPIGGEYFLFWRSDDDRGEVYRALAEHLVATEPGGG